MELGKYQFVELNQTQQEKIALLCIRNMNRSSVDFCSEMVDVEVLWKYREFDRHLDSNESQNYIDELSKSILDTGILYPLMLEYNPYTRYCRLGEGNHRLMIAKGLGLAKIPVYVYRSVYLCPEPGRMGVFLDKNVLFPYIRRYFGDVPFDGGFPTHMPPSVVLPELSNGKRYAWTGGEHSFHELNNAELMACEKDLFKMTSGR